MKNFKFLLVAAVVFAAGSAFTTTNKTVLGEYVLIGNTWEPAGVGTCIESSEICKYLKTGSATTPQYPNEFQNPANFSPNEMGTYLR